MGTRLRRIRIAPVVALAALSGACTIDAVSPGGEDGLSLEESLTLARLVGLESLGFGQAGGAAGAHLSPAAAGQTVTVTYALTRPCLLGGSVDSSGRIRVETDPGPPTWSVVDVEATDVHEACVFQAGTARISVTGDPKVTTAVHAAVRDGRPWGKQTVSVVGGLAWSADDGRSGRCALDVRVEVDPDTPSQSTRGSFCGHTFDVTVTGG